MGNRESESLKIATEEDFLDCLPLIVKFFNVSPYSSEEELDEGKIEELFLQIVNGDRKNGIVLFLPKVGILIGFVSELPFNRTKMAAELIFWVEPEHRGTPAQRVLRETFEYWCKKAGCKYIQMTALEDKNYPRVDKYYKRKNYKLYEHAYLKEI